MNTPVYLKMDSPDDSLLSEGVCRQLGIIQYHKQVRPVKETSKSGASAQHSPPQGPGTVPIVKVSLIKSVHLLPHQSVVTDVVCSERGTIHLVEQIDNFQDKTTVQVEATLVKPDVDGLAKIILSNPTGRSCDVE